MVSAYLLRNTSDPAQPLPRAKLKAESYSTRHATQLCRCPLQAGIDVSVIRGYLGHCLCSPPQAATLRPIFR